MPSKERGNPRFFCAGRPVFKIDFATCDKLCPVCDKYLTKKQLYVMVALQAQRGKNNIKKEKSYGRVNQNCRYV